MASLVAIAIRKEAVYNLLGTILGITNEELRSFKPDALSQVMLLELVADKAEALKKEYEALNVLYSDLTDKYNSIISENESLKSKAKVASKKES